MTTEITETQIMILKAMKYIMDYVKSPRIIIFVLTVAAILVIKKILIEKLDTPISLKKRLGIKDAIQTIRYIGYSIKTDGSERLSYADWKANNISGQNNTQ